MPTGPQALISLSEAVQGSTTEKTFCSRMRRAINCVVCAPKSRMTMDWLCDEELSLDWGSTDECLKFIEECKGRWGYAQEREARPGARYSSHHDIQQLAGNINCLDYLFSGDEGLYFFIGERAFDDESLRSIRGHNHAAAKFAVNLYRDFNLLLFR